MEMASIDLGAESVAEVEGVVLEYFDLCLIEEIIEHGRGQLRKHAGKRRQVARSVLVSLGSRQASWLRRRNELAENTERKRRSVLGCNFLRALAVGACLA
jgi:hypothetical protein